MKPQHSRSPHPAFFSDSTFTALNVFPGEYRIRIDGRPTNVFMKDVRLGGTDLMRETLVVGSSSPGTLEIVLSQGASEVKGTLVDKQLLPVAGSQVVLIPAVFRARRELYRTATTDTEGRFRMPSVTPGDYKAFAWEDLEPFSYYDPEVISKYEQQGTSLKIPESGKTTVQVTLVPLADL